MKKDMKKDIRARVTSYEDACEVLGEKPVADRGDKPKDEIAYIKLKAIIKALNEGWIADYKDRSRKKWFPGFSTMSCSGFAFYGTYYVLDTPIASGSARLCLKSGKLAKYAGEQRFLSLWEDFLL